VESLPQRALGRLERADLEVNVSVVSLDRYQ
jgi:hypothetical protein